MDKTKIIDKSSEVENTFFDNFEIDFFKNKDYDINSFSGKNNNY